jgi:hypothetical protein
MAKASPIGNREIGFPSAAVWNQGRSPSSVNMVRQAHPIVKAERRNNQKRKLESPPGFGLCAKRLFQWLQLGDGGCKLIQGDVY